MRGRNGGLMPQTHKPTPRTTGRTKPLWFEGVEVPQFGKLSRDAKADVCIVGAGIAGLTTAYLLARAGRSVVVLDERPIGGGESGRTSAHLASAIDDRFTTIEQRLGPQAAKLQYESHSTAIDTIERICLAEEIECDFARVDGFLFLGRGHEPALLQKECEAARRAGFHDVGLLDRAPVTGVKSGACLRFPRQARFHPLKYLAGLARTLQNMGVRIYCGTRVGDLSGDGPVLAKLEGGPLVHARHGVAATNVPAPIDNWLAIYTKQASYRSYVVGMEVQAGVVSDALYWDTEDPYHYVRLAAAPDGRTLLVVGGADHRVGTLGSNKEADARFAEIEGWARDRFCTEHGKGALGPVAIRWSGQVAEPDDGVAFLGRVPTAHHRNCFVITGDSGMGLTGGTAGAILVSELILREGEGKPDHEVHPWAALYDPARSPARSLGATVEFLKENAAAAASFSEYLTGGDVASIEEIPHGSGAVMRDGAGKIAVYKDERGEIHKCSAICTHLKCIVRWNGLEKSWDCPCHGSRFDPYGRVLMGPAVDDLAPQGSEEEGE